MAAPLISVIVPVYNAERYVAQSLQSILNQSIGDLELIVIDDGSTDNSAAVIEKIKNTRLHLHKQANAGMAAALNKGISLAKGKFIARQDADDISLPDRFEKQLVYLSAHPGVGLLGTQAALIDGTGKRTGGFLHHSTDNETLKATLYFDNPFVHSSVMLRKETLDKVGLYNNSLHPLLQDFDLWFRISQISDIGNLPEVLQEYRQLPSGISATSLKFSELVATQCYDHLSQLSKDPELREFACFYHKCFDRSGSMNPGKAFALLKEIEQQFLEQDKLKEGTPFKDIYVHLKRAALDMEVYKSKPGTLRRLVARIKRRFLMGS